MFIRSRDLEDLEKNRTLGRIVPQVRYYRSNRTNQTLGPIVPQVRFVIDPDRHIKSPRTPKIALHINLSLAKSYFPQDVIGSIDPGKNKVLGSSFCAETFYSHIAKLQRQQQSDAKLSERLTPLGIRGPQLRTPPNMIVL